MWKQRLAVPAKLENKAMEDHAKARNELEQKITLAVQEFQRETGVLFIKRLEVDFDFDEDDSWVSYIKDIKMLIHAYQ
jgi:hypothetical protein